MKKQENTANGVAHIDRGVPIPTAIKGCRKYPWLEMDIGDSFFAPISVGSISQGIVYARSHNSNLKFTRRTVIENGVKGVRVWRIA